MDYSKRDFRCGAEKQNTQGRKEQVANPVESAAEGKEWPRLRSRFEYGNSPLQQQRSEKCQYDGRADRSELNIELGDRQPLGNVGR